VILSSFPLLNLLDVCGVDDCFTGSVEVTFVLLGDLALGKVSSFVLEPDLISLWMSVPGKSSRLEIVSVLDGVDVGLVEPVSYTVGS
jgi:hypothetical protein